ncbi:unnamed protein product [Aphanomyces euteiches]
MKSLASSPQTLVFEVIEFMIAQAPLFELAIPFQAPQELHRLCSHPSENVRNQYVRIVRYIDPSPSLLDSVVERVFDSSPEVVSNAMHALGRSVVVRLGHPRFRAKKVASLTVHTDEFGAKEFELLMDYLEYGDREDECLDLLQQSHHSTPLLALKAGVWEAAKWCVYGRLRTHWGNAGQTFGAIERLLLRPVAHPRLLVEFVHALEMAVVKINDEKDEFHAKSVAFFTTNKKVCEDWLLRIRPALIKLCDASGVSSLSRYHALSLINSLSRKPATTEWDTAMFELCISCSDLQDTPELMGIIQYAVKMNQRKPWMAPIQFEAQMNYEAAIEGYKNVVEPFVRLSRDFYSGLNLQFESEDERNKAVSAVQQGSETSMKSVLDMTVRDSPLQPWERVVPQLLSRLAHPDPIASSRVEKSTKLTEALSPQLVSQVRQLVSELRRIAVLWDESWLTLLSKLSSDVARRSNTLEKEATRVEKNTSLSLSEKTALAHRKFVAIMKPVLLSLETLAEETIGRQPQTAHEQWFVLHFGDLINSALSKFESCLEEDQASPFRQEKKKAASSDPLVFYVWSPFADILKRLQHASQRRQSLAMMTISPTLASWESSLVHMPGLPSRVIQGLSPQVQILATKTRPKSLEIIGSDGHSYRYLLKAREDLHLDERIMQLLITVNACLSTDKEAMHYDLTARNYSVIPLSNDAGLIQMVPHVTPLFHIFTSTTNYPASSPTAPFYAKLKSSGIMDVTPSGRPRWPIKILREVYNELVSEHSKLNVLLREMMRTSETIQDFGAKATRFSRSTAVMSVVGYIIGLGDRHLDNMLLCRSGDLVHIDYNICFDKGKKLKVPEVVPFRLTPILHSALGLTGVEGRFRHSMETTLRVMRASDTKETILTLLEAFVYDPLVHWKEDATSKKLWRMEMNVQLSLFSSRAQERRSEAEATISHVTDTWRTLKETMHATLEAFTLASGSLSSIRNDTCVLEWKFKPNKDGRISHDSLALEWKHAMPLDIPVEANELSCLHLSELVQSMTYCVKASMAKGKEESMSKFIKELRAKIAQQQVIATWLNVRPPIDMSNFSRSDFLGLFPNLEDANRLHDTIHQLVECTASALQSAASKNNRMIQFEIQDAVDGATRLMHQTQALRICLRWIEYVESTFRDSESDTCRSIDTEGSKVITTYVTAKATWNEYQRLRQEQLKDVEVKAQNACSTQEKLSRTQTQLVNAQKTLLSRLDETDLAGPVMSLKQILPEVLAKEKTNVIWENVRLVRILSKNMKGDAEELSELQSTMSTLETKSEHLHTDYSAVLQAFQSFFNQCPDIQPTASSKATMASVLRGKENSKPPTLAEKLAAAEAVYVLVEALQGSKGIAHIPSSMEDVMTLFFTIADLATSLAHESPESDESDSSSDDSESEDDSVTDLKKVQESNQYGMQVLTRVKEKLDGENSKYSVEQQVEWLIQEATSVNNLCQMYEGWTPWI